MTASPYSNSPSPPVVEMRGVTVGALTNPDRLVLEDVNWTVTDGDYWVLAGLHRSGKSDLLALAAGLSRPVSGEFLLFGVDLCSAREEEQLGALCRAGFAFAGGRMLHQLTVAENIALPLCYHRDCHLDEAASDVAALLAAVGLSEAGELMPAALGRSALRRAGLARAMMLRPQWLVVDDPLSSLDAREARWWLEMLDRLAVGHEWFEGRPLTLAVASDDLRPWARRARQFAVLKDRRFTVCAGRPSTGAEPQPLFDDFMGTDSKFETKRSGA